MKLKQALLHLVRRRKTQQHAPGQCSECEKRADESLHQLANRLHVVEFETNVELYGPDAARRRLKPK